jgi:gamma-glutamylputrescine oxidase
MIPKDQVYWYTLQEEQGQKLEKNIEADVVIAGGGMAGLMCAQACQQNGLSAVVLEGGFCGSGASGKSSGFITPDSELELSDLVEDYGEKQARELWEFVVSGCEAIRSNILNYGISCDYQVQDSLFVASAKKGVEKIRHEHETRQQLDYNSRFYDAASIGSVLGSSSYPAGVRYSGTFGIASYLYCQRLKNILSSQGVQIYEHTPVQSLNKHTLYTPRGKARGQALVFCTDWCLRGLGIIPQDIYHAQTFLSVSKPLGERGARELFPDKPLMVWDTDLIYQYFRLTGDRRLLLGGSSLLYTYAGETHSSGFMAKKLRAYLKERFPSLEIELEYLWPGLIGVSKDFLPLAGRHHRLPHTYYLGGAAGLPWAASLGRYLADKVATGRSDMDHYFSAERDYPLGHALQKFLGTKVTFALSHGKVKYLN